MDLADLGVGRLVIVLQRAGIRTVDELAKLNARQLRAIEGIGPVALARIETALANRGLSLATDAWDKYTCARDGKPSWDTALESLFLCDQCASDFEERPFAGTKPAYVGDALDGFCGSCNEPREVRLRQWYLCGICSRVTKSIGRGVIAARFVLGFWAEEIAARVPGLVLRETDPPRLERRRSETVPTDVMPDLTAFDRVTSVAVLGIELKGGKSSIRGGGLGSQMSRFQLDQTDCDDIEAAARRLGTAVYLMHVQVIDRASPPTTRFAAVDFWWTDIFAMRRHFQEMKQRPRENRPAAYFDVRMFKPGPTFADHIRSGAHKELTQRAQREGVPDLYPRR